MDYFIGPDLEIPSKWKISADELSTHFAEDWVVVACSVPDATPSQLDGYWKIRFGVYDTQCWLLNEQSLCTDGDLVRATLLAHWYRQFVPHEIELKIFDGSTGSELVTVGEPFEEGFAFQKLFHS